MTFDKFEQQTAPILLKEIHDGNLPREVGKYRTLNQVSMFLKNPQLWFATVSEFNDPFEGKFYFKNDARVPFNAKIKVQEQMNDLLNQMGVLCLTDNLNNILMWSHYADKHRGAILVFDMAIDPVFFSAPFKVLYSFKYPSYPLLNFKDAMKSMACKFIRWQHENEIRVLKPHFHGLRTVKKEALTKIIFGCKADDAEITKVIEEMQVLGGYEHVELQKAVMDKHAYRLNYVTIEGNLETN